MKNRIIFILLFLVITIIGLNGTKITASLLGTNDDEELKKPRSSDSSGAIYLSPDEISFNPMSIVDKENSKLVNTVPESNRLYGNDSFDICCIMDSLIRNISIYSEKAEYVQPVEAEIFDSIYAAPNGLYYIEKHPYYNKFNNRRYVDLIMDSEDLSIRYINFYDDQQHSVSADAVQRGIEKFNQMSVEFYSKILTIYNTMNINEWFYGNSINETSIESQDEYPDYFFDPFENEQYAPPGYNGMLDYYISCVCENVKIAYKESGDDNPMNYFFAISSVPSQVSFNDKFDLPEMYDEDLAFTTRCVTSSLKFMAECVDSEFITNEEFAAYNSKIYMTITFHDNKKIIIYNILTNEIEGFCNFYNNDTW